MTTMRDTLDAQSPNGAPDGAALALLAVFNGTTFDRARGAADNADGVASIALGLQRMLGMGMMYNGASWDRTRTPNVFKTLNAVVITSETTIWTPAAGKKFRLMGFLLTQGALTGAVTLKDNTGGSTILIIPQTTIGVAIASPPMGNGILSAVANNVLTAIGATAETLTGFVFGTEE